jgi:hypothetical protein
MRFYNLFMLFGITLMLLDTLFGEVKLPALPCPYESATSSCAVVGCPALHRTLPIRDNDNNKRTMNELITGKIDVTKIDKDKLYKGKKGTYLDFALIPTPDSKYGDDYMVVQSIPKEERDAGKKGEVLGNCRIFSSSAPAGGSSAPAEDTEEDVPF